MNKCTVIFTRNRHGEIEMFRQVNRAIAQEGYDWNTSMRIYVNRLCKTLIKLKDNERLVLDIKIQQIPMR